MGIAWAMIKPDEGSFFNDLARSAIAWKTSMNHLIVVIHIQGERRSGGSNHPKSTRGGTRTHTSLRTLDFESSASANSATLALTGLVLNQMTSRPARPSKEGEFRGEQGSISLTIPSIHRTRKIKIRRRALPAERSHQG